MSIVEIIGRKASVCDFNSCRPVALHALERPFSIGADLFAKYGKIAGTDREGSDRRGSAVHSVVETDIGLRAMKFSDPAADQLPHEITLEASVTPDCNCSLDPGSGPIFGKRP